MCILSIYIAYLIYTVANARSIWVEVKYRRPFSSVLSVTTLSYDPQNNPYKNSPKIRKIAP